MNDAMETTDSPVTKAKLLDCNSILETPSMHTKSLDRTPSHGLLTSNPERHSDVHSVYSELKSTGSSGNQESDKIKIGYTIHSRLTKKRTHPPMGSDLGSDDKKPKTITTELTDVSIHSPSPSEIPTSQGLDAECEPKVKVEPEDDDDAGVRRLEANGNPVIVFPPLCRNESCAGTEQFPFSSSQCCCLAAPQRENSTAQGGLDALPGLAPVGNEDNEAPNYDLGRTMASAQQSHVGYTYDMSHSAVVDLEKCIETESQRQAKAIEYAHSVAMSKYILKTLKELQSSYSEMEGKGNMPSGVKEKWDSERGRLVRKYKELCTSQKLLQASITLLSFQAELEFPE